MIRRDTEILAKGSTISLIGERQRRGPWGLQGGTPGSPGVYRTLRANLVTKLPSKTRLTADSGDVLSLTTPGGGGYGPPKARLVQLVRADSADSKA